MGKVIFAIQQIGPYHHARFQALSKDFNVLVIETRPSDTTYSWNTHFPDAAYQRERFYANPLKMAKIIGRKPIFICGWYDKEMLMLLGLSCFMRSKRIIISDSRAADAVRVFWKEKLKQFILKFYSAGLVAGKESEAYLRQLHFTQPIEKPWDVVDEKLWKPSIGIIKENYWVFPARLVEKKNHAFFLSAFAQAIEKVENPPKLYLCGDGPLQLELEILIEELSIGHLVVFKGFVHTNEMIPLMQHAQWMVLPSVYDQWGLVANEALAAETSVLISDNCGAKEMIVNGENGYVFNDHNLLEILSKLLDPNQTSISQQGKVPPGFRLEDFIVACKNLTLS
jgi:glycosyltransferase involved in cell wall biosynthesis